MAREDVLDGGCCKRKITTLAVAAIMLAGMLAVLPLGTQNASGYMTPGMGMMLTFDDLVLMSGGAVTGSMSMYQVHETITVMPTDTLILTPGLIVQMDPGMMISIEVLGTLDGNMGMGTLFHSGGPGTWRGIWVHDSGALTANGLMIMDATDAIYIDHTMGFGMVQITGCQIIGAMNSGITMLGTMGGPMVQGNTVSGSPVGFRLVATTAQCQNNEVMNCGVGFSVQGNPGPGIFGNRIHDNMQSAILVQGANTWLNSNVINENRGDAITLLNSTAGIDNNDIWGWNATVGSGESGGSGIRINGSVEWGQNYITNNRIYGGRGDATGRGGHGIHIEEFNGNPLNDLQIENTVIENNQVLRGGDGGHNIDDWGYAGNGGHGLCVGRLPDEGDPAADNHALRVSGNSLVCGGRGGDDLSGAGGYAGHGGHGLCVSDDNDRGSMLATGNKLVLGGDGGSCALPTGRCGDGGHGMCIDDCGPGVRLDIRDHDDMAGGRCGPGPSLGVGGAGLRLDRSSSFHVDGLAGRSDWSVVDVRDCNGDFELRDIRVSDSNANNGNLVRATGSSSTGNNENWVFGGKNGVSGVVAKDCGRLKLRVANATTSNATGFRLENCTDISLDRITVTVRDGTGVEIMACTNLTLTNATLNGSRESPVPEQPVLRILNSTAISVGPSSIAFGNNKFAVVNTESSDVTILDATNFTIKNTLVVGENCAGIAFGNGKFNVVQDCNIQVSNGTGINATGASNLTLRGIKVGPNPAWPGNGGGMKGSWCFGVKVTDNTVTSSNRTGIDLQNCTSVAITNTTVNATSATGISASNLTVLWVNYSKVNVPHPTYNGHGVRLKAIARGGCSRSEVNVSSGPGRFRWAISLDQTNNYTVENCTVKGAGGGGISLNRSRDSTVRGNTIQDKEEGMRLQNSQYNVIFHNNFLGNAIQASEDSGLNDWDDGYPSGGNYWSDYAGPDAMKGPLQNIPGPDGIGDVPYLNIQGGAGAVDQYPLMAPWVEPAGPVQNLNTGEYFDTIQKAIDDIDTLSGHSIHITMNNYIENVNITKQLTFLGGAVLTGNFTVSSGGNITLDRFQLLLDNPVNGTHNIFIESGSEAFIENESYIGPLNTDGNHRFYFWVKSGSSFTMRNSTLRQCGYYPVNQESGLFVQCDNAVFEGNEILEGMVGIYFYYSNYSVVKNNYIHHTITHPNYIGVQTGLLARRSVNITIEGNIITFNQRYGVELQWTSNCVINNNNISNNYGLGGGYGVYLVTSYYTKVTNNTLYNNAYINIQNYDADYSTIYRNQIIATPLNGFGISVRESNDCIVWNNTISNPLWGIYVQNLCTGIVIKENHIDHCRGSSASGPAGIKLSSVSSVRNNTVSFSDCGIYIFSTASNSVVYHNNFIQNNIQAYDEGNVVRDNSYPSGGNFWSDYSGIDWYSGINQDQAGSDGIGDTPYIIDGNSRDRYPLMAPPGVAPPQSSFNISLDAGWNLISIPLAPISNNVGYVLSSISGAWDVVKCYDTLDISDPWKTYRVNGTANDIANITHSVGIWLHATKACTLTVAGNDPGDTSIPLYAGWNLVGYPSMTPRPALEALAGTGADMISAFDGASPYLIRDFTDLSMVTMAPGNGYWVHVPADSVWTVDW